ncbi:toll-like receptor 8 [Brachionichthys hirsutus]|uniref:toll-like receptor 8 n=1 Tax=Brachionichthys hirsutus TaxID=412623 RepID=UPI00360437C4
MHLLLFGLCCHCGIQTVACKPEWMSAQFPCDVTASNDSTILFDCKGRHLREVPRGITSNATELNLSYNFIGNISVSSFSNLLNLTRLSLNCANKCRPIIIKTNAFKKLVNLQKLRLSGNQLDQIPSNLPSSVEILELNSNKITWLDNRSFAGLSSMTHLWLTKNCYSGHPCRRSVTIVDGTFMVMKKLQELDLSFNNLTHVPKGLPQSLLVLQLACNQIEYINEDDLLGLKNLKILKIQGNCPRCGNAPYPCVPCQNISLRIHSQAFQSLTELEVLNMGGNSLKHMKAPWFERMSKLRELLLPFNLLLKTVSQEAPFLRNLPKLENIDISFNFELQYYPQTLNLSKDFQYLVSLKTLHLQGLVFKNIGPDTLSPLYQLRNLTTLNLGTNFIIHSDSTIFHNLSHLKITYLAENRLYPAPVKSSLHLGEVFHQMSRLPVSPLHRINPNSLVYEIFHQLIKQECLNAGRALILSSNNLFFISPNQFQGYGNIACLNLSGNGFSAALNGTEFSLLPNLTYLDLSFNRIDLAYDYAFRELENLQVLDLSHNPHYFEAFGITHNLNFMKNLPALRVLNMSYNFIHTLTTKQMCSASLAELRFAHNHLGKLWKETDLLYKMLFRNLTNLTILDISYNGIAKIPNDVYQYLPRNLTTLCVSHNKLTDFTWDQLKFFHQLQSLDLSFNSLHKVAVINPNTINALAFLDLSHNSIFHLDNGFLNNAKSLHTLSLDKNLLTTINQSTFQPRPASALQTLLLQGNPFQCTCDSLDFILWLEKRNVKIPGLITQVTCDTPANQKGHALIYFDINQCVNDNQALLVYILTYSFVVAFMLAATVAHLFYWDASYVLHYVKAKLSGYGPLSSSDSIYDVFVTYDNSDPHVCEWVMKNLRVKLEEEGERHLPLCLEERDWPLGVPLVDNLTRSIRCSRKTLFVLTEGYVKTGTFKLAMYLAHQRLLDENVDVIVVLLLDPVLQYSHFLRLRKRVCGASVVEWPRTPAAQPWFWQNLRNVIRVDNKFMCNKTYSKYFTQRHYRQVLTGNQAGVCRYGRRLECCYGWKKNSKGQCEAQCEHGCRHGECVGPNKCKCFPGYTGKTCNQDLNECGLKPRPCEHRCMNSYGSYKCYCLNGYTLMPDGACANSRTCSLAHCQYGCEDVHGEIRCICPSVGLQLGQDERTCVDIDECAAEKSLCPYNRQCVNTFGSFYCKCQEGYDLKYVNGKYDCVDHDECAAGTHTCSHHADCLNTRGAYKCRCKSGFRGNGFECSAIPDSQFGSVILGGKLDEDEDIKNAIPDPVATPPPGVLQQPFDYDRDVYIGSTTEDRQGEEFPDEEEEGEEEEEDNQLNPRGDVFTPEDFESVFGPVTEVKEIQITPVQEDFLMDCNFDQGECEWLQDRADNMDWSVAYHDDGTEYYMAMSGLIGDQEDVAKLKLLLGDRVQQGSFCLTFDYLVTDRYVGTLRVLLDNSVYPVWEQSQSRDQRWQTEFLTVAWEEEAPESIVFEARRGRGVGGEIGLDNVVLTSGPCQEDADLIF